VKEQIFKNEMRIEKSEVGNIYRKAGTSKLIYDIQLREATNGLNDTLKVKQITICLAFYHGRRIRLHCPVNKSTD
jgi:hypothetical protein